MSEWTRELWHKTLGDLFARASRDEEFRRRCVDDAAGAIREISGLDVPETLPLCFVEPFDGEMVVLPPMRGGDDALSERELETVAGGARRQWPQFGGVHLANDIYQDPSHNIIAVLVGM